MGIKGMGKICTGAGAAFQGGSPKAQRLSQAGTRRGRATNTARSLRSTPLPDILHKWCGQEAEQWGSVLPRPLIGPANGLLSSSTTRQATGWEGTLPTYDLLEEASCSEEAQKSSEEAQSSSELVQVNSIYFVHMICASKPACSSLVKPGRYLKCDPGMDL